MRFTKMQGLGNDYLYVRGEVPDDAAALARRLSDRHFGVGADGVIWITDSVSADFGMRIFNADGSEAMMCGNGIRCVGRYVYDRGYTDKTELRIETRSGIRRLWLQVTDGQATRVTVDMGCAVSGAEMTLRIGEQDVICTPVSVGNPHAVIFTDAIATAPVMTLGPEIAGHSAFPGGVNVEFVQPIDAHTLRMRVWERGSGLTMACGTGACASATAAVQRGICRCGEAIAVILDGGTLEITVRPDGTVFMNGPAAFICDGESLI